LPQAPLIACVDDDSTVLEAMEDFLDASGFVADGFSSAEDFLKFGQLQQTSCLITDVKLGGMSGLQLQDRLAMSGFQIPTIVITAFADEKTRARALTSGAVCFLSKPISKESMLECIRAAVNVRRDNEKS
jgi:FixJ family two-component response regulator